MNKRKKIQVLKNNKAITLIALVVTIIVLIILAGVSISLVLGDNGIIEKAKEAKQNTEHAKIEEEMQVNETVDYLENLGESGYQGGNYDDPYIPIGFTHIEGTWNSGYTIKDKLGNEFVWVPCVINQAKVKEKDKVVTFGKTLPNTSEATDVYYMYNNENLTITGETGITADEIQTSVGIYGGFYIAKYEAGIQGDIENYNLETKIKVDGTVKPLSQSGKGLWNNIKREDAIIVSKNMIDKEKTGSKSALISGAAWDTTLRWIVSTSDNAMNEPNVGFDINSQGKGWYSDRAQNKRHLTGYYSINNIYDIAGNIREWTTEECKHNNTDYCVSRGGYYYYSGANYPAANRKYSNDYESQNIGFRVVLYK